MFVLSSQEESCIHCVLFKLWFCLRVLWVCQTESTFIKVINCNHIQKLFNSKGFSKPPQWLKFNFIDDSLDCKTGGRGCYLMPTAWDEIFNFMKYRPICGTVFIWLWDFLYLTTLRILDWVMTSYGCAECHNTILLLQLNDACSPIKIAFFVSFYPFKASSQHHKLGKLEICPKLIFSLSLQVWWR